VGYNSVGDNTGLSLFV